jgi:hypothetical protein
MPAIVPGNLRNRFFFEILAGMFAGDAAAERLQSMTAPSTEDVNDEPKL